ncbi:MAG: hypothetical protein WCY93_08645 [Anaerolineaceae bacterium]
MRTLFDYAMAVLIFMSLLMPMFLYVLYGTVGVFAGLAICVIVIAAFVLVAPEMPEDYDE